MSRNGKAIFGRSAAIAAAAALALGLVFSGTAFAIHKEGHGGGPGGGGNTIGDLDCTDVGAIAKFDGGAWGCAEDEDSDTQLDAAGIEALVGPHTVDSDTQLDAAGIEALVGAHTVDTDTDTLRDLEAAGPATCADGSFARLDPEGSGQWQCLSLQELRDLLGLSQTVFLTSRHNDGNLVNGASGTYDPPYTGNDGLEAGDFICNALADDAGLPGEFVAWLSGGGVNARDRLTPDSGPFRTTRGTLVAIDIDDLTDGGIMAEINITEVGTAVPAATVWTGTGADGFATGADCQGWTVSVPPFPLSGTLGDSGQTDFRWTDDIENDFCEDVGHLYCFHRNAHHEGS